jgi:large subunit ribosomal protein L33
MEEAVRGLTAQLSEEKIRIGSRGQKPCVAACQVGGFTESIHPTSCLPAEVAGQFDVEENHPMREIVTLQCPTCKNRNYSTTKNKKTTTGRLEFSKFCNTCRKHTPHKETK